MSDNERKIDELQERLKELETINSALYSEFKAKIGWPISGERPINDRDVNELEKDALDVLDRWIAFQEQQNRVMAHIHKKIVNKRRMFYENEKKVDPKDVTIGKTAVEHIQGKRKLDL
jgi:hypothetical protein